MVESETAATGRSNAKRNGFMTGDVSISQSEIEQYERDGAIVLRKAFSDDWVERMRGAAERVMADGGPLALEYTKEGGKGRFFGDQFIWPREETFRAFVFDSPAAEIARRMMRSRTATLFYDHLLVKEAGTKDHTPWHHDLPYWPVEGDQVCSIWLALDPVSADSGGVEYIRGSHKWGKRYIGQSFSTDFDYSNPDMEEIPDIEAERDRHEFLVWDMEPGDCIVHHALTLHHSGANATSDRRRRGLATRWTGDDAVYTPRASTIRLLEDPGLPDGAPMPCKLFPQVLPR
jgi:ectoine hydroxylase-related dioxygenase (phytanoyl-CoA dioxygenase family)